MRITIVSPGSRGDVQPFIGLGLAMQAAGHEVTLASEDHFTTMVESHGLRFHPTPGDTVKFMVTTADSRSNFIKYAKDLRDYLEPILEETLDETFRACEGADAICYTLNGFAAHHAAEKLGIPAFHTFLFPFSRTRKFPTVAYNLPFHLDEIQNLLSHHMAEQAIHQLSRPYFDRYRARIGLEPLPPFRWPYSHLHGVPIPVLYGISDSVIAKPYDWRSNIHLTGYWFLDHDSDWAPTPELADFLASGPAPVVVGFGSLPTTEPARFTEVVAEALKRAKRRGILVSGWGGLASANLGPDLLTIPEAPHDWLFPQTAAVVHHGGAGTTAAALRAGVPAVVVPFAWDQPFWANRVYALGVAPPAVPADQLTAERLAAAIRLATEDSAIGIRAKAIGAKIAGENGPQRAVDILTAYIDRHYFTRHRSRTAK